jgi:PTH1 family peptidyl-tRNA hydrolase
MTIKLIVGLKNPGEQYAKTRHNAGAWVLEELARAMPTTWATKKDMLAELAEWVFPSGKVLALLPTTFMNLNGQSVSAVARYYRIEPNEILVAHDDLDLPVGVVRIKKGGGHGGHNGLQDLIRHLGSADFYRLRMGIGHPGDKTQVANYVLNAPTASERKLLTEAVEQVIPYIPRIVQGDIEAVMNSLHRR